MAVRRLRSSSGAKLKALLYLYERRRRRLLKNKRRYWVHPINKQRSGHGEFNTLYLELRKHPHKFQNYSRMSVVQFDKLCELIGPKIKKKKTNFRSPISCEERILITLRFLATGQTMTSLHYQFRVGISTVCQIINETCTVIADTLQPIYINYNKDQLRQVSHDFQKKCHFPNCFGAIDGKHIQIKAPANSGSEFFNYKKTFSIVLLAMCDANNKFTKIDVGTPGRFSDGGIFQNSEFFEMLQDNNAFPNPACLPNCDKVMPHVIVGDEAFPLMPNLMRPFPSKDLNNEKRTFNYRLSCARRTIENTFGILAHRFRIFMRPIDLRPDNVVNVVRAACSLHNFVMSDEHAPSAYHPTSFVHNDTHEVEFLGQWRAEPPPFYSLEASSFRNYTIQAKNIRNDFAVYFSNRIGSVPWQQSHLNRGMI